MLGWKRRRRRRLRARPLPDAWGDILSRRVACWDTLDEADRRELAGHMQVFLHEKRFEGCGGLRITDEIRVTIAAQACLLLLHRATDYFPGVVAIVVYPSVYWAPRAQPASVGVVDQRQEVREGESWARGAVVLAWDRVRRDAEDAHGGHNVALHEFAHQLDLESGAADGAPVLAGRGHRQAWARAFSRAYADDREALAAGRHTFLGAYAATSPAEFFAVATEAFFEQPRVLCAHHPALYGQLAAYFLQEPSHRESLEVREPTGERDFWTISVEPYGAYPIV